MTVREMASLVCAWVSVLLTIVSGVFVIIHSITFPLVGAQLVIGIVSGVAILVCGVLMFVRVKRGEWRV